MDLQDDSTDVSTGVIYGAWLNIDHRTISGFVLLLRVKCLLLSNLSWSRRSLVFTSTFQCTTCEFDNVFPVFDHTVATHLFKNSKKRKRTYDSSKYCSWAFKSFSGFESRTMSSFTLHFYALFVSFLRKNLLILCKHNSVSKVRLNN